MIFEVFNQNSKYYREMMDIILKSKNNPPEKGQIHHIIPRSWFKHYNMKVDNSISNTVLLTCEDHKKVHSLAYKCAKEKWFRAKMACAAHLMGDKEVVIKLSEETKIKLRESHKGLLPWNTGKHHTDETKIKIRDALKGRKLSEETCNKMSNSRKGRTSPMKGRKHSEETKHKQSISMKGKNTWMKGKHRSEETKIKLSKANKGRIRSEETKLKMRGRKCSEETKQKMSESAKQRWMKQKGV